ncbi:UNVERIFIED_CONTAM: hypothetical protein K2H54_002032 [Gekko kuhli]
MSDEEEDLRLPGEPGVLVTTTPMGTRPRCKEEKTGWEEHLACMERAQNQLIPVVDDALMGILATVVQLVQDS